MSGDKKSALIVGATGAVGKHVLRELLASDHYARVGEVGRRVTAPDALKDVNYPAGKLEQRTIDFEKIQEAGLKEGRWDDVFITLGTTKADAGSAEAFKKIDHDYVVNAARAAKTEDASHQQRVIYCSSTGASASSPFLYPQSKGKTENDLADIGFADTIIFRPGFLAHAERGKSRLMENLAEPMLNLVSYFTSAGQIDVALLGKAMVRSGVLGSAQLPAAIRASTAKNPAGKPFTIISNSGALSLAKQDSK